MKVGLPLFGRRVSPHFGASSKILLVETMGKKIVSKVTWNVEKQGALEIARALVSSGVEKIICGGIENSQKEWLNLRGVQVIDNQKGDAAVLLAKLILPAAFPGAGSANNRRQPEPVRSRSGTSSPRNEFRETSMKEFTAIMKALRQSNRVKILKILQHGELCVCEIQAALGMSQGCISKHLEILKRAGLVDRRKKGLWAYFSLAGSPRSVCVASLLHNLKLWLEDDAEVTELVAKLPDIRSRNTAKQHVQPILEKPIRK